MKVLFISHDASRTGAPLVLLNLLLYLKNYTEINCSVILLKGGGYSLDFSRAVEGHMLDGIPQGGLISRLKFYIRAYARYILKSEIYGNPVKILKGKYDYVYANTIVSAGVGYHFSQKNKGRLILHLHEHDYSKKAFYKNWNRGIDFGYVFKIIAVSDYSKKIYIENWKLPSEKISVLKAFVNLQNIKTPTKTIEDMIREVGLKSKFVIGGCGVGSWRKGFDIFLELCKFAKRNQMEWDFLWVGSLSNDQWAQIEYEQSRMSIGNLYLTGETASPQNYLQILDVFTLTSREDPFPLVCLEAASLEKPIVLFNDAGGMPEFVEDDAGKIVPYGDIQSMFDALKYMEQNPEHRNLLGKRAAEKVKNYDVSVMAPRIVELFE